MTSRRALVWAAVLLGLGACRGIAGLHDLEYVPADASCGAPSLPTGGSGRVRLVNAGTQGGGVDFCIRPSGASAWGRPLLAAGPLSCDAGLAYALATVPFAVQAGAIDVEAVPVGSACDAAATSQALGVPVGDWTAGAPVVTLVRFGGGTNPEQMAALPEEPSTGAPGGHVSSQSLRLVNALASAQPINMGLAQSSSLPTTVANTMPAPVSPGGVEPQADIPGLGSVDAEGYLSLPGLSAFHLGVVLAGQHDAIFAVDSPSGADTETIFAIGDSGDTAHPVRGLVCEDQPGAADAGGTIGDGSILAQCTLSRLPSLAVDTFNTSLYGANAPFYDQRRTAVYDAIAARTSDLMCLLETALDWKAIAQQARAHFPYSYVAVTDLSTTATDPTDATGNTPPAPGAPPCAGVDPALVTAIYQCLAQSCSSSPGDMSGHVQTTNCLSAQCAGPLSQLYNHGPQLDGCFDCIAYNASGEATLAHGQQECTQDPRQPFAYDGMNTVMMLSRYPLKSTQAFILPGTGFRRAVLYAQVELEDQVVDFFCGHLTSPLLDGLLPYVGSYGKDVPNQENGWRDEQDLQVQKAVAWIERTRVNPAIIAGDWHATFQVTEPGPDGGPVTVLTNQSPEVMQALDQALGGAFVRAEPPDYVPSCEYCPSPQNVYNVGSSVFPEDYTPMFLSRFPPGSTTDDTFWGTDNSVPLTSIPDQPAPPTGSGPISGYYPRVVHVLRPPVHGGRRR